MKTSFKVFSALVGLLLILSAFVFPSTTASAVPLGCHPSDINVSVGECTEGGRSVTVSGYFSAGNGYAGKVFVDGEVVYDQVFTGPEAKQNYSHTGVYPAGSHKVEAVLYKYTEIPPTYEAVCPKIDWSFEGHNVVVEYDKSNDPNKCHRPSDKDLKDKYGMSNSEKNKFKDLHSEWMDPVDVVMTDPGGIQIKEVSRKVKNFTVDPCAPPPCSAVTDEVLVNPNEPWGEPVNNVRSRTFEYVRYDANNQGEVCSTREVTEEETLTRYCVNGVSGMYWPSEAPDGAVQGPCGTRPVCVDGKTEYIEEGASLPEGAVEGYCEHSKTYCFKGKMVTVNWDDSQTEPLTPEGATETCPINPKPTKTPPPVVTGAGDEIGWGRLFGGALLLLLVALFWKK